MILYAARRRKEAAESLSNQAYAARAEPRDLKKRIKDLARE